MQKSGLFVLVILLVGILFSTNVSANVLFDTDGNDYLEIHDCYELQSMKNDLTANYELMNDIDCSMTRTWNLDEFCEDYGYNDKNFCEYEGCVRSSNNAPLSLDYNACASFNWGHYSRFWKNGSRWVSYYKGFIPIGDCILDGWEGCSPDDTFTGDFNGNNHYIRNLYMFSWLFNNPFPNPMFSGGLFAGAVGSRIENTHLSEVDISYRNAGGFGYTFTDSIISCSSVEGTLKGTYVGGVVGYQTRGLITNSYFRGNINTSRAGSGIASSISGLDYTPIITNSYSEGNISGDLGKAYGVSSPGVGGIGGILFNGEIHNSYSHMNFFNFNSNESLVGSIIGKCDSSPCLINSYGSGYFKNLNPSFDRLFSCGIGGYSWKEPGLYFNADEYFKFISNMTCGLISNVINYSLALSNYSGLTTEQMKTPSTFTDAGWNTSIWNLTEGNYPTLYMRECTPVEIRYNFSEGSNSNLKNIICSVEINNLPNVDVHANFSLYEINGSEKIFIDSSGWGALDRINNEGFYNVYGNYTFSDAINITSPAMVCGVEFDGADSDNIKGIYFSENIVDIDGDGYMSFAQAKSLGKCSDFNVDVEGEDDWPFDDVWGQLYGNSPGGDEGPSCQEFEKINCSLDTNGDGLSDYNMCAKCRNKISTCSGIEDEKYIGKCESGSKTGYWLRGVGWMTGNTFNNWMIAHQYPNYISSLSCNNFYIISPPLTDDGITSVKGSMEARKETYGIQTSEYLDFDGFIELVHKIEEDYFQKTSNQISSRDLASAIALTFYAKTITSVNQDSVKMGWPEASKMAGWRGDQNNYLFDIIENFILRYPEFHSADNVHYKNLLNNGSFSPLQLTGYREMGVYGGGTPHAYASPLGKPGCENNGGECVVKKVYYDGYIYSMSHAMMATLSRSYIFEIAEDVVFGYKGEQNGNGNRLGFWLRPYIEPNLIVLVPFIGGQEDYGLTYVPNPFYTPKLSDALKLIKPKMENGIPFANKLEQNKLIKFCELLDKTVYDF